MRGGDDLADVEGIRFPVHIGQSRAPCGVPIAREQDGSCVRLGIGIDDQHLVVLLGCFAEACKGVREVHDGGRFAHTALVVEDRNDAHSLATV